MFKLKSKIKKKYSDWSLKRCKFVKKRTKWKIEWVNSFKANKLTSNKWEKWKSKVVVKNYKVIRGRSSKN